MVFDLTSRTTATVDISHEHIDTVLAFLNTSWSPFKALRQFRQNALGHRQ